MPPALKEFTLFMNCFPWRCYSAFAHLQMGKVLGLTAFMAMANIANAGDGNGVDQGPWWVTPLATIFSALIAASVIVYQFGRQHKNESERQAGSVKAQLKLEVYKEFSACLPTGADAMRLAYNFVFTAPIHLAIYSSQVGSGFSEPPISEWPSGLSQ